MTSVAAEVSRSIDSLRDVIRALCRSAGLPGDFMAHRIDGGANNQVYRLNDGERNALLKVYFRHPDDPRNRLGSEFAFLRFAWARDIDCVPEPLAIDREHGLGLQQFIEGHGLEMGEVGEPEITQAADFFIALNHHRTSSDALKLPTASEACFSVRAHVERVEQRVRRLEELSSHDHRRDAPLQFIQRELRPTWNRVRKTLVEEARRREVSLDTAIGQDQRCISPSDFGFHNAIRVSGRRLRFVDFEYAGWDDPAKMICDFFCQPRIPVPPEAFAWFATRITDPFDLGEQTIQRARLLLPAYRVKWCCITLNKLLPAGRARRQFAGAVDQSGKDDHRLVERARGILRELTAA